MPPCLQPIVKTTALPAYWKHVLTVLGGAVGAQALPLLASPLITRMCTPADMGAFSVWLGIVSVASVAATLRLEAAMILDRGAYYQRMCFSVVAHAAAVVALLVMGTAMLAHHFQLPITAHLSWPALISIAPATWIKFGPYPMLRVFLSCFSLPIIPVNAVLVAHACLPKYPCSHVQVTVLCGKAWSNYFDKPGPSIMLTVDMAKDDLDARLMLVVPFWYTVILLVQPGTSTLQYVPAGREVW